MITIGEKMISNMNNIDDTVECCECNEVHEELLKIVNETMPEETELYDLAELLRFW